MTEFNETSNLNIPVDAEHGGIRTVGCISFIAGTLISILLWLLLLQDVAFLAVLLGIASGIGIAYLVEYILRGRWTSGRFMLADETSITLKRHEQIESKIDPNQTVNVLLWHFIVKRASRVKKGWHVVSLGIQQDDEVLVVYTFASPEQFESMPLSAQFTKLERESKKDKAEEQRSAGSMRRAGEQRRLFEAEQVRGDNGAEVTYDQFLQIIAYLQKNYASWMIS